MSRKNVTFIDDLPDIEDIGEGNMMEENKNTIIPDEQGSQIYKKFIRNHDRTPDPQSGMISNNTFIQPHQQQQMQYAQYAQYPQYPQQMQPQYPQYPQNPRMMQQPYPLNTKENYDDGDGDEDDSDFVVNSGKRLNKCIYINCRDIACHVTECPVCCKLYKSDSTVFIVIIILLSCLVLFLLQKLFYINKLY